MRWVTPDEKQKSVPLVETYGPNGEDRRVDVVPSNVANSPAEETVEGVFTPGRSQLKRHR